jgi:radical SAM protein with 4Fe4S-binding SPASM domain
VSEYVRFVKETENQLNPRFEEIVFELTERCNNDCIHCSINLPENDENARKRELATGQVKDILKQAADIGYLHVRFTGGEPLLRPDFEELYLFARRLGMKVLLFTNGRLITPHLAQLFADIPPLQPIEVTVYGMRRDSYEAVTRTPGSFEQFRQGVNRLRERHVPFLVKSVLLPQNTSDRDEFEAWAKTLPWMTQRPAYALFFDFRERRDNEAKNRLIESLRVPPKEGVSLLLQDEKCRKELSAFAVKFIGQTGDRLFVCSACEGGTMCVDAYGRAQPCMGIRAPGLTCDLVGTDGEASLQNALDRFALLRGLRATNPDYLKRCARCFLSGLCEQCPAKSWAEQGTHDTPVAYFCDVAHAMARTMGWLGEREYGWEVRAWRERIK